MTFWPVWAALSNAQRWSSFPAWIVAAFRHSDDDGTWAKGSKAIVPVSAQEPQGSQGQTKRATLGSFGVSGREPPCRDPLTDSLDAASANSGILRASRALTR